MIHLESKDSEITATWRILIVLACIAFGIYLGGAISGYYIAQAQYSQRAAARDKTVGEIKQQVAQLPNKTADAVKQAVQDDSK
ncbi:hypothetical protein [Sodalis ligni]|uniref:hypothetical protein n=1 Tax=Sodalis ligni TaxID=2697027 RepID=UPI001050CD73|nr:hypothetical protein [Sodalis ligni]